MQPIILICGVPGSGKTWACKQVEDKYWYVPHDDFPVADYHKALLKAARMGDKPILGECPFRVSVLIEELRDAGGIVHPYYIVEDEATTIKRYEARTDKTIPKMHLTNLRKYAERGPSFTSEDMLKYLKSR